MTSADRSPEPPGSWRLSWDELAERTGATLEELVSEDVVSAGSSDEVRFRRVGPVSFKGVSRDVVVYEAERA